jgi:hypothetical protein
MQRGVFTWRALLAVRTLARSEAKLRALQKERRRLVRELHKIVNELGPQCVPALSHFSIPRVGAHDLTSPFRLGPEVWENRVISPEELQRESHEKNKPVFYKCSSYLSNAETREDKKDQ